MQDGSLEKSLGPKSGDKVLRLYLIDDEGSKMKRPKV